MLYSALLIFGVLLFFHFLADYPLQGDFLAKAKNQTNPIPHVPWQHALFAHSFIQAGFVYLATGNVVLFVVEFFAHGCIDYQKSRGELTFAQDQYIHIAMKAIYAILVVYFT